MIRVTSFKVQASSFILQTCTFVVYKEVIMEKNEQRRYVTSLLEPQLMCSVRERFDFLKDLGLEDNQRVLIDCQGAPRVVAYRILKIVEHWDPDSGLENFQKSLQFFSAED